mmetsp:Transcript_17854/g.42268  ORF Transcript_17854/g.42268 Transcript_17854/m.42268 type:complete len:208 (+) Transcript_17854:110-733(+)
MEAIVAAITQAASTEELCALLVTLRAQEEVLFRHAMPMSSAIFPCLSYVCPLTCPHVFPGPLPPCDAARRGMPGAGGARAHARPRLCAQRARQRAGAGELVAARRDVRAPLPAAAATRRPRAGRACPRRVQPSLPKVSLLCAPAATGRARRRPPAPRRRCGDAAHALAHHADPRAGVAGRHPSQDLPSSRTAAREHTRAGERAAYGA